MQPSHITRLAPGRLASTLLASLFLVGSACKSEAPDDTSAPATTDTPATQPAPRPTPPTPEPWSPPPDSTLLSDVDLADWPGLCDLHAVARPDDPLFCGPYQVPVPGQTRGEAVADCVARFGDASQVPTCQATVADLAEVLGMPITCETLLVPPDSVTRVRGCEQDPPAPLQPDCPILLSTIPTDGALGRLPNAEIVVVFDEVVPDLELELSAGGVTVDTVASIGGSVGVFDPVVDLEPTTLYRFDLTWCGGFRSETRQFATGQYGSPIDPATLVGNTLALDPFHPQVVWVEPPAIGPLFLSQVDMQPLIGFDAAGTELTVTSGQGSPNGPGFEQSTCIETQTETVPFDANPAFDGLPTSLRLIDAPYGNLRASGVFDASGQSAVVTLDGLVDTRPLVDTLTPGGGADAVCALISQFGANCQACPDGELLCLYTRVEDMPATLVSTTMVPVTADDVTSDPTCP